MLVLRYIIALIIAGISISWAQITVTPVMLCLKPQDKVISCEIANGSPVKRHFQAKIKRWSQIDGQDVYEEVHDWIISPKIFSLESGKTQLIRLLPKDLKRTSNEQSFRLLLEEIFEKGSQKRGQVRIALRLSLPIFIYSSTATNLPPVIQQTNNRITIMNPNNHHIDLIQLNPKSTDKQEKIPMKGYLLPGQTYAVPIANLNLTSWQLTYGYLSQVMKVDANP